MKDSFKFPTFRFQRRFQTMSVFIAAALMLASFALAPFAGAQNPHPSAATADTSAASTRLVYPESKRGGTIDNYFGTKVADPYRWLEDDAAPEVASWVEAQNKVTFAYLDRIPYRSKIKDRLLQIYNYAKYSAPSRRGDYFYYTKNDGLQNQSIWYRQKGLDGTPEVLIDPNKLSADGTSKLAQFSLSRDGRLLGYGVSQGGSDWSDIYVMDVASRGMQPDHLKWVKVSGVAWAGNGFYYSRYPEPVKGHEMSTKNEYHQVFYHKVGTPQSEDALVYEDKDNAQRFHQVSTSDDERFAFLTVSERGKGKRGNALYYHDNSQAGYEFKPIVAEITDDTFQLLDNDGDKFLIFTDYKAPNGRVFVFDPKAPEEKNWKDVLPEKAEVLDNVNSVGGKLFATYLKDVATHAFVYDFNGKLENEIKMPGFGVANGFGGRKDDPVTFYTFTSLNYPSTIFKYDIASGKSSIFRQPEIPGFKSSDYETQQVFYPSKDGTKVPMFLVYKKGLKLDGNNPTMLYGYGGFNVVNSPSFSSLRLALLEQGFVFATANMRGGGEYGEKWHEAGTKLKKQNVFDDFIAAAEYLIKNKYTNSNKLAIHGVSNGGLLVGAVANQRPELYKAVIQQAGVMDMLRFHKFTIGWNWVADYGSSDNAAEFKALYAYSPIHNMKQGASYPATLITTADHDDRVVPAHSFKYAAALQAAQGGSNPILIRIDTKSGHGASSTTKSIEQNADIYSFLMWNLGVTPTY